MGSEGCEAVAEKLRRLIKPGKRKRAPAPERRDDICLWERPQAQAEPHRPTAWEVPYGDLVKRAHGCPQPTLLYDPKAPAGHRLRSIPCGKWDCPSCGPKRCAEFTRRVLVGIAGLLEEREARGDACEDLPHELTLTFQAGALPGASESEEQLAAARQAWDRWLRAVNEARRRQDLPRLEFVKVWEYTTAGVPHVHCAVIGNPWPVSVPHRLRNDLDPVHVPAHRKLAKERGGYLARLGFGFVHTWQPLRDRRAFGRYLAEYVTKAAAMNLPKHCPRYSASRGFMPGLRDWRTVRAAEPGLLDVPGARSIEALAVAHPSGGIACVAAHGRFWRKPEWARLVETYRARSQVRRLQRRQQGGEEVDELLDAAGWPKDEERLKWLCGISPGGAGGVPLPEPAQRDGGAERAGEQASERRTGTDGAGRVEGRPEDG